MRRITSTTLGIALLLLATHSITNPYVIQVFHLIIRISKSGLTLRV